MVLEQDKTRYINPFTDFGFKKLFGEEPNKDLLLDFLNQLLGEEQGEIKEISYLQNEHLGANERARKAVFDIHCTNDKGEKFIVELQKTEQKFFKDRTVYYSTFPIAQQAKKGDWNYELKAVYMIAILNFVFDHDEQEPDKYRYDVQLTDIDTFKVFYDKLKFIYLEMPKFTKDAEELSNNFEKWMYVLRNLSRLERIPANIQGKIFEKLFEVAEYAKLPPEQVKEYEENLKHYRDLQNSVDTAEERGRIEGRAEGRKEGIQQGIKTRNLEIAKVMLKEGCEISLIEKVTKLSKAAIEKLVQELK